MAAEIRAPKRARFTSSIVAIKVGTKEEQVFSIHEDVIKESSAFFRVALDKKWKEGQTREIELPQDRPEVVSCYVDWIYSGTIASKASNEPGNATHAESSQEYTFMARLYVFGEKIQDDAFCDAAITGFAELADQTVISKKDSTRMALYTPGHSIIEIIYDGTPSSSPARRFLVDLYIARGQPRWYKADWYLKLPESLRDLLVSSLQDRSFQTPGVPMRSQREKWFKRKANS